MKVYHGGGLFGYVGHVDSAANYPNPNAITHLATGAQSAINNTSTGYGYHNSGNWVQRSVPLLEQYCLYSIDGNGRPGCFFPNGMAVNRLDGTDTRLIAHQYSADYSRAYFRNSHPTISGNGLLVLWTGDMNNTGGTTDNTAWEGTIGLARIRVVSDSATLLSYMGAMRANFMPAGNWYRYQSIICLRDWNDC